MTLRIKGLAACLSVAALALTIAPVAHADLIDCTSDFSGPGPITDAGGTNQAWSSCQYDGDLSQSTTATKEIVNILAFFGFSDWETAEAKADQPDGTLSGTWVIDPVNFAGYDYMIVFKDGQDTGLIGFTLNEVYSSGAWVTPFREPPFDFNPDDKTKAVSHFAIFKRGAVTVSEPGTMALLGLGLLGMGLARRRIRV